MAGYAFARPAPMTAMTASIPPATNRARSSRLYVGAHPARFVELADVAANAQRGKDTLISPIVLQEVRHIDAIFDIQHDVNGLSAEHRQLARQE